MFQISKREFFTIVFEYYNFWQKRSVEKKIKLYSEEGKWKEKKEIFPPNMDEIYSLHFWQVPEKKEFQRWFWEFAMKEPDPKWAADHAADLARQDKVMEVVKMRAEKYNYNCGLIQAGTGVGKSVIAIKIAQYHQCNTLILVSNTQLLHEMHERFEQLTGMNVGRYGDGYKDIDPITVCTKISFSKDYEKICAPENRFETLVIDECHDWFSDKLRLAINKSFKQANLYGMSATPYTPDMEVEDLERYFGKLIDVKDKYDYTPDFEIIDYKPGKVWIQGKELSEYVYQDYAELRGLMAEDTIRFEHQITKLKELYNDRNCIIVLTDRVLESNNFYDRLAKWDLSKFNLIKITGETDTEEDKKLVKEAMSNWKKTIIIGSIQKIGTGFDLPPGDTVFLVSAIKWKSRVEQAIGRVLRKYEKKNPLVVIWNDEALKWQKAEKEKTIKKVYGVQKSDIKFFQIWDHRMPHEKMTIDFTDITQQ